MCIANWKNPVLTITVKPLDEARVHTIVDILSQNVRRTFFVVWAPMTSSVFFIYPFYCVTRQKTYLISLLRVSEKGILNPQQANKRLSHGTTAAVKSLTCIHKQNTVYWTSACHHRNISFFFPNKFSVKTMPFEMFCLTGSKKHSQLTRKVWWWPVWC